MYMSQKKINRDMAIFSLAIIALVVIGIIFIYAASSVYALEHCGSALYFVKKQIIGGILLGLGALIIARSVSPDFLYRSTPLIFFISLALTAFTLLPGLSQRIHGSSRWISFLGFGFQPSELLKISLILYTAHFLTKKEGKTPSFIHGYLPFLIVLGITSLILLKQPDFGLTVTLIMTTFLLLFIAQFQTKHLLLTLLASVPAVIFLILMQPYRIKRILTFLNPWADPQGAGFQIIQSLIAIGSGNVWGVGIGNSKQKFFYLPMQHTDFIFSIIAEETGFIGSLFLIFLYTLFLYMGLRIAWQMKKTFFTFTILGFVILISLQALINLAVATGMVPTKGIGLPFVSYGNTALVCNIAMIGIIIAMVRENRAYIRDYARF